MRVRRHLPPLRQRRKFRLPSVKIRGAWPWFAGAAVLGYLVTVVWLFPEPIQASDNPVPRVMDLPRADAIDRLSEAGFRGRVVETEPHPDAPSGTVTWQDPPPALEAPAGAVVRLTVSNGPPEIPIPDVVGLQTLLAREILQAAGFDVGRVDSIAALSDLGSIVVTRPGAGVARSPGTAITLVVSQGPAVIPVPSVVGLTHREAWDRLAEAGLKVGRVMTRPTDSMDPGRVVEQRPAAGTRSPMEGKVDLIFSRTPRP
jgi:beta-lactam-binding protein with PASTA domain